MTTTTPENVFQQAIHLMDEQNEMDGEVNTVDTEEYKFRTLDILNILRNELYPFSDTYSINDSGERPICPQITSFDQVIDLDDAIAQGVLPYGLAAHLLIGEDDAKAAFFQQRYDELKFTIGRNRPGTWEEIPMPFG